MKRSVRVICMRIAGLAAVLWALHDLIKEHPVF